MPRHARRAANKRQKADIKWWIGSPHTHTPTVDLFGSIGRRISDTEQPPLRVVHPVGNVSKNIEVFSILSCQINSVEKIDQQTLTRTEKRLVSFVKSMYLLLLLAPFVPMTSDASHASTCGDRSAQQLHSL